MNQPFQSQPIGPCRGIRISSTDTVVLLVGTGITVWLHRTAFPLWWAVPMVLGHFFLFCNVFLVRRKLELLWAGFFMINAGFHVVRGYWDAWPTCGWQIPVSLLVIGWEILSPRYHGVGSRIRLR